MRWMLTILHRLVAAERPPVVVARQGVVPVRVREVPAPWTVSTYLRTSGENLAQQTLLRLLPYCAHLISWHGGQPSPRQ